MLAKQILVSVFIGAAIAAPQPAPEPEVQVFEVRQLLSSIVKRDAASSIGSGDAAGCTVPSSILSLATGVPSPPSDLISAVATITDPCAKPSFTGKLSSDYASYSSAVSVWAASASGPLNSWVSSYSSAGCPGADAFSIPSADVCSTANSAKSGSTTSSRGASASGASASRASGAAGAATTSGSGSAASTGAASLNQVAVVGGAVFAGFAGIMAAL